MIQTASIISLVKTILIIVLAYTVFKYIMRLLAPFIIRSIANKMAGKFNQYPPTQNPRKEGEVSIDKTPNKTTSNKDVGEYIDFEEVD